MATSTVELLGDWTYTHLQDPCWRKKNSCFAKRALTAWVLYHGRIVFGMADDRHLVPNAVERIGTRSISERMTSVV
jgi:hypothetical protein